MGTKSLFGVKQLLTTFDAADICYVTPNTIKNWIKSGQLKAYCTPGGHYRIRKEDLDRFVQEHQMATKTMGEPKVKPRVLAVGLEEDADLLGILKPENYEVLFAASIFEAGIKTVMLDPDVFIVDVDKSTDSEIEGICKAVKTIDSIKHIPVIAVSADEAVGRDRMRVGATEYITRPLREDELTSAVDRWAFKMLG
jgi:excisionase family DNA binding protein